jgi:hypothetical protein
MMSVVGDGIWLRKGDRDHVSVSEMIRRHVSEDDQISYRPSSIPDRLQLCWLTLAPSTLAGSLNRQAKAEERLHRHKGIAEISSKRPMMTKYASPLRPM